MGNASAAVIERTAVRVRSGESNIADAERPREHAYGVVPPVRAGKVRGEQRWNAIARRPCSSAQVMISGSPARWPKRLALAFEPAGHGARAGVAMGRETCDSGRSRARARRGGSDEEVGFQNEE